MGCLASELPLPFGLAVQSGSLSVVLRPRGHYCRALLRSVSQLPSQHMPTYTAESELNELSIRLCRARSYRGAVHRRVALFIAAFQFTQALLELVLGALPRQGHQAGMPSGKEIAGGAPGTLDQVGALRGDVRGT